MAITSLIRSIPGIPVAQKYAPPTLTGDYDRQWEFMVALWKNPGSPAKIDGKTDWLAYIGKLFDTTTLFYVQEFIQDVEVPATTVNFEDWPIGSTSFPIPKSWTYPDLRIQCLDDSANTCWNFWKGWQLSAIQGLSMNLIYPLCLSMMITPMGRAPFGVQLPTSPMLYTHVFPYDVKHSTFKKSGTQLSTIDISLKRLPTLVQKTESSSLTGLVGNAIKLLGKF